MLGKGLRPGGGSRGLDHVDWRGRGGSGGVLAAVVADAQGDEDDQADLDQDEQDQGYGLDGLKAVIVATSSPAVT